MHPLKTKARQAAWGQALLWSAAAVLELLAMWAMSLYHPFGFGPELTYTAGICLLGAAAAGSSFMISGWCCTAGQIQAIPDEKLEQTYAGCSASDMALRQYNVWCFCFFGLQRCCSEDSAEGIIQKLEEGCEPRDIFSR